MPRLYEDTLRTGLFFRENTHMETKCPLIRNAVNAWLPGDLNRMFERITTDPSFKQYSESLRPTFQARIPMKRQTISWDRGCLHILRISCLTNPSALFKSVTISVPEKSHGSENWTRPVMLDSGINPPNITLGANDCAIIPTPDYRCAPSHRGAGRFQATIQNRYSSCDTKKDNFTRSNDYIFTRRGAASRVYGY
jgi:hypothetical protein